MKPDLDALADFVLITEQWEQGGSSFDSLLQDSLPVFQRVLPGTAALRLYFIAESGDLLPAASTDDRMADLPPSAGSRVERRADGTAWLTPTGYLLVEVVVDPQQDATPDAETWLQLAAQYLTSALERQRVDYLLERQVVIARDLTRCSSLLDIAEVLGKYLLGSGEYIVVNTIQRDEQGQMVGFKTIAAASRSRAHVLNNFIEMTIDQVGSKMRRVIERGEPVLIPDVQNDPEIHPRIKMWSADKAIVSACVFPIVVQGEVFGVFNINGVGKSLHKTPREMQLLRALTDHIGVVIHSQHLLDESRQTQAIASQLVKTNRAISAAESYGEMCRAILNIMPDSITMASVMLFDRMLIAGENPKSLHIEVVASRDDVFYPQANYEFPPDDLRLSQFVEQLLRSEAYVTGDSRKLAHPLMAPSLAYFAESGIYSFVTVGLRAGGRLQGMLAIGSPENITFNKTQLDNIVTIADQIAATIEGRQLLQEREAGLMESWLLYNINRELLETDNNLEVLRIIRKYLATGADSIEHFSFQWEDDQLTAVILEDVIDAHGERSPRRALSQFTDPEVAALLVADREQHSHEVDIIDDLERILDERPAARFAYEAGVRSQVIIPLYDEGRFVQQINIHYKNPHTFDEQARRLYEAVRDQIAVILENRRLLRDTQAAAASLGNQVRILQTINHLVADLSNTQNEQLLMDKTCEALVNALRIDHSSIALVGDDGQSLRIVSEYPAVIGIGTPVEDDLLHEELQRERYPIIVTDIEHDPRVGERLRDSLKRGGVNHIAFLPLVDPRAGYLGAIGLTISNLNRAFTSEMIDTARTITAQMTVTLQNIRLLRSSQYQSRQLEGIVGFGQSIQTTFDIPTLMEVTVLNLSQIVPAHHIGIHFYDVAQRRLKPVAIQDEEAGIRVDLNGVASADYRGKTAHQTWEMRDSLFVRDLHTDGDLRHTFQDNIRAVMSMPVISRGAAVGVIEVGNRQPGVYSSIDQAVFQQLVSQFAIAVENAEAYTQSQRLAQSKVLVNEITTQLQRQVEVDQIIHVTARELGKALGARRARVRLDVDAVKE